MGSRSPPCVPQKPPQTDTDMKGHSGVKLREGLPSQTNHINISATEMLCATLNPKPENPETLNPITRLEPSAQKLVVPTLLWRYLCSWPNLRPLVLSLKPTKRTEYPCPLKLERPVIRLGASKNLLVGVVLSLPSLLKPGFTTWCSFVSSLPSLISYYTILYDTILYCTTLYYTIPYDSILYYTILYYTTAYLLVKRTQSLGVLCGSG